jgi:hypothetical protein
LLGFPRFFNEVDLSISLSNLVCAHHNCTRCLFLQKDLNRATLCPFRETIQKNPLIYLLRTVDHLDASNPSDANKQGVTAIVRDNLFFPETKIDSKRLDDIRSDFYSELEQFLSCGKRDIVLLNRFVKLLADKYFFECLSETRKFGNDITLLDHAKSVAAYYKTHLFNYFVKGKPFPKTFFDVHFRILAVNNCNTRFEEFLSTTIAMSNLVARTEKKSHFLLANSNSKKLLAFFQENFGAKAYYGGTDDFSAVFKDSLFGHSLNKLFHRLKGLKIKNPEDIKPNYTQKDAIADIKKVVYFALLRRYEAVQRRFESSTKHLSNLELGSIHDEKNLVRYFRKKAEVDFLKRKLKRSAGTEKMKSIYRWKSSHDGAEEVYNFFNEVLSPIRPPSPIKMSEYLLKDYLKHHSFKRIYNNLILLRPIILARVYAFFRTLNEFLPRD